jgi:hypothetical protein
VFQAIENAGQYTQPLIATKARQPSQKASFILPLLSRWSQARGIFAASGMFALKCVSLSSLNNREFD